MFSLEVLSSSPQLGGIHTALSLSLSLSLSLCESISSLSFSLSFTTLQAIFLEIAVDFQPSALSGTEGTLKIKVWRCAWRQLQEWSAPIDAVVIEEHVMRLRLFGPHRVPGAGIKRTKNSVIAEKESNQGYVNRGFQTVVRDCRLSRG